MALGQDWNLLFGVFAVQLKKISPSQLVESAAMWATDPSRSLAERMVENGALSEKDRRFLEDVVERAIEDHEGDAKAAVASFGGVEEIQQTFRGSIVLNRSGSVQLGWSSGDAWAPGGPLDVPAVQETPGRYTCVGEHSHGGMGRILIVHDEHFGRDVALKELLPAHANREDTESPTPVRLSLPVTARFLAEARITGQLEHPSIVPVYELGHRMDGTLYYTMKLVRGQTLTKSLAAAPKLRDRLLLLPHFLNLCQAIAYAHDRGVIHRDIKPDNVMIGEFGETVVIDWGIAKTRTHDPGGGDPMAETVRMMKNSGRAPETKTAAGAVMGTPLYMSPEQAAGRVEWVDERSDIYSLGAVLYELLTGRTLHKGRSLSEILERIVSEEPASVRQLEPHAPPELTAICQRAIQKNRLERYTSVKELAADIQRFMQGQLVHAYRYGTIERVRRFAQANRAILFTALLVLTASYALSAVSNWFSFRQSMKTEATALANCTAEILIADWIAGGTFSAKNIEAMSLQPRVMAARLFDAGGKEAAVYRRAGTGAPELPNSPPPSRYAFADGVLWVSWPIEIQRAHQGDLCFAYTIEEIGPLKQSVNRSAALLVVPLCFGTWIAWNRRRRDPAWAPASVPQSQRKPPPRSL